MMNGNGHGKSPYAALCFRPPLDKLGAGLFPVTVSLSNRARLASGAFPEAVDQPNPSKREFAQGFTLIEILLAIFILGIVLTTVYASYTGTFRIIKEAEYDAEAYGIARSALDRISRDLLSAAPWGGAFTFKTKTHYQGNQAFVQLTFRSTAHVSFGDSEVSEGIAVIEYRIEEGTEKEGYALWRSDSLSRDPAKEDTTEGGYLLGERIEGLTWLFYDDNGKEYDSWDSAGAVEAQKKRAPAAVQIQLRLVNEADRERPLLFSTRVHLPINRVEVQ